MGSTAGALARMVRPADRRLLVHLQQALALSALALLIFLAIVFARAGWLAASRSRWAGLPSSRWRSLWVEW